MTILEPARLKAGKRVWSNVTSNPKEGWRVTAVWLNDAGTIARLRVHSLAGNDWLPTEGFDLTPPTKATAPAP